MKLPELPPFDHQPNKYDGPSADEVLRLRKEFLNPGIFLYYKKPIMLVEGKMQYLWDEHGRRYLDALGGIVTVSVGHCHPDVVDVVRKQNETLQHSTTIYLHPNIAEYAEKLASKMPGDLKVCYFVNSGSEANDLALLMARAYTGNYDVIALRNAYHGGSTLTMAKGIGNGCPMGAVVTTPKIAATLSQRVHFNTFGGNPVVCAQAGAVLDVIDREKLQANSLKIGNRILAGLNKLKEKHSIIGDVRGKGLLLGIELVKDRQSKEPAKEECAQVMETGKEMGLLLGKGGLWGQTIRFSPPMCVKEQDADFLLEVLDRALGSL